MRVAASWSLLVAAATVVGAGSIPARAAGAADAARPKSWYEEVAVNGFVSTSYSYNFNQPSTHQNAYRVFDFDDDTFKLDVMELVVQRAVAKPRESGFRVDVAMGGSVPRVSAARGLFRDAATGTAEDVDLQQVFASYLAPLGSGLRLDAGKFVTPHGAEVIEGYDGWNDNATRSLLFGFAIPFTHTGVRASYSFNPHVSAMAMVVNGWDNATDNNKSKTVGAQLLLTGAHGQSLCLNGMIGPERDGNDSDTRSLLDVTCSLKPVNRVTIGLNLDWGVDQGVQVPGNGYPVQGSRAAQWSGEALYARWQLTQRFALAARGEGFDDSDGARTGHSVILEEMTLTPEFHVSPRFVLRADLRGDRANRELFLRDRNSAQHQTTILVNALTWF